MGDDIGWMQPSIYHEGLVGFNNPAILKTGRFPSRYRSPGTPAYCPV